jgi:REP element-mobilizing transposase RayT
MARPLRIEFEGAVYHVSARGNAREEVFVDDRDRERFMRRLAESVETYDIRLYLYCLMPNHVHLVLETPRANLSRFAQSLLTGYAVYFNLRHERAGHLTQGRFHARLVDADEYLLRLSRYVHLNPVSVAGADQRPVEERIAALRAYPWSSYRSYVGLARRVEFVDYEAILATMGGDAAQRVRRYREFVEGGLAATDEEFARVLRASPRCIGGEAFRQWVDGLHDALLGKREREDISHRRPGLRLKADEVLEAVCRELNVPREEACCRRRGGWLRPLAAHALCKYAGTTQRETARILGLGTGAAVSTQLAKLRRALHDDRKLQRALARIELALGGAEEREGTE